MAATSSDPLERLGATFAPAGGLPSSGCSSSSTRMRRRSPTACKNLVVYALPRPLRGRRDRHRGAGTTRPSCLARPRARATTWSSRSAATAPSTRPRTASPAPTPPLSCLPGGATNVYCRMLGIPADVVDATEQLLRIADDWRPRRVDLGDVNGRKFAFSAGVGLDASVVERVDAHPRLKARLGEWYFTCDGRRRRSRGAISCTRPRSRRWSDDERVTGVTRSSRTPPRTRTSAAGRSRWRRAQRSRAATWPAWCWSVRVPRTSPRSSGAPSPTAPASANHRHVHPFSGVRELTLRRSMTGRCRCRSTATTSARSPKRSSE